MARHLTLVRQPQKLPVVLTLEEVARLIEAAPGPKYKAALGVAYGAGLRVSEVANLRLRCRHGYSHGHLLPAAAWGPGLGLPRGYTALGSTRRARGGQMPRRFVGLTNVDAGTTAMVAGRGDKGRLFTSGDSLVSPASRCADRCAARSALRPRSCNCNRGCRGIRGGTQPVAQVGPKPPAAHCCCTPCNHRCRPSHPPRPAK
jgi:hypothetical protein